MKLLIVLEYARARAWDHTGPWGSALARGLAARGHEVTVLADGAADPGVFDAPGVMLELRRPERRSLRVQPFRFAAWADRRAGARGAGDGAVSISLTRRWCGDVWVPMGRPAAEDLRRLLAIRGVASIGMQGIQRLWIGHAILAERSARARAQERAVSVLSVGEPVWDGVRVLPISSPKAGPVAGVGSIDRASARRVLRLSEEDLVLVASAAHYDEPAFELAVGGVGAFARRADRRVRLLVTGGRPHKVARIAEREDASAEVVPMGQTDRMDVLLAAADGAVVAARSRENAGTGRLVAEAVSAGVPVAVGERAAGATELRAAGHRGRRWGVLVEEGDADAWARAVGVIVDPSWRASAVHDARAEAPRFAFGRLVDAIEAEAERVTAARVEPTVSRS